ncbi:pimeloyl-ACP methyl ester carboxylesterase [Paenibacillus rhizosphaerae]|uniref:Pimeloyl-ACP methyl ester carboxylesterase n=1 Tax=Paenibacillus rhizosphaerae TaxID=297318 RepID=A0A839TSY4_9BACL|nr:alpha/beta hydrolase [Paenibacillus rhizosphaerae]MBB3129671.1 pimeloyl-ACP methyl ester carboxylesterase [Paenibacillus rhizosphaerae]
MEKALEDRKPIGYVFIPGAGLDARIWDRMARELPAPWLAVDYPGRGTDNGGTGKLSLKDYCAHVKEQIRSWDVEKFILVTHSLGGVPGLNIAAEMGDRVAGFAAVGAVIPAGGGSFASAFPSGQRLLLPLMMRLFGTKPPEQAIRRGLCSDLTDEQADEIVRRFTPESIRVYTDRVEAASRLQIPSLYIKLGQDQELKPGMQDQMAGNLGARVERLESGHLPMLSHPNELRQLLQGFCTSVSAAR